MISNLQTMAISFIGASRLFKGLIIPTQYYKVSAVIKTTYEHKRYSEIFCDQELTNKTISNINKKLHYGLTNDAIDIKKINDSTVTLQLNTVWGNPPSKHVDTYVLRSEDTPQKPNNHAFIIGNNIDDIFKNNNRIPLVFLCN